MFKQFTNLKLTCPPSPFWFREDQNYMLFPGNALQVDTTEIKLEKRDYTTTPDGFFIYFLLKFMFATLTNLRGRRDGMIYVGYV